MYVYFVSGTTYVLYLYIRTYFWSIGTTCRACVQHSKLLAVPTYINRSTALNKTYSQHFPTQITKALLTGDSGDQHGCRIPGGFGAAGQPNDGWHQYHHKLSKAYASAGVKWNADFVLRRNLDQLSQSMQTSVTTKPSGSKLHHFVKSITDFMY